MLVDLKGAFGYLKEEGTLYNVIQSQRAPQSLWDDTKVEVVKEDTIDKPPFIKSLDEPTEISDSASELASNDIENNINSWVDYLLPRFHPRTSNIIKQYRHGCATHPFDIFTYGRNLWNTEQFSDDFSERIRVYVEECDLMQGFQACDCLYLYK